MLSGRGRSSFLRPAPGARFKLVSLEKAEEGYGRFLGYLAHRGELDPACGPEERITEQRMADYFDELKALGNADYTIIGRFSELAAALQLLAPHYDFRWIQRPHGLPLRTLLSMERRHLQLHHSRVLYEWGLTLCVGSQALGGAVRRRVMLRDGLLICLLAARAPRQRTVQELEVHKHLRRVDGRWLLVAEPENMKAGKPMEYPLPASLTPWIDRYVAHERVELLAGKQHNYFWVNWNGERLGRAGLDKRLYWWTEKRFGKGNAFGAHRFRYCLGTIGPMEDPDAAIGSSAILGNTAAVHAKHYDRGERSIAARRFHQRLRAERKHSRAAAQRMFAARLRGEAAPDESDHTEPTDPVADEPTES